MDDKKLQCFCMTAPILHLSKVMKEKTGIYTQIYKLRREFLVIMCRKKYTYM